MQQIYDDLWQTSPEHPLPGFPTSVCHAYLLVRDAGNVLFYSTGREAVGKVDDRADHDRIDELGGVRHILLSHWHEASPSTHTIRERFGATLVCHAREAPMVEKVAGIAPDTTFWERQKLLGDIEAIPTPGHTVGSACYFYNSPRGQAYLFTGDTIWPARGSWTSITFEDDAKQSAHRSSLELLATLQPTVVLSAISPTVSIVEVSHSEWQAAIKVASASLG
jgi:glyoxylase-like metal-dependent hydrolase (beta-lactamase superfamily II)